MDQLFKALPRDLQWEIISEFVGTHAVRKGKLIRKMVIDDRHRILENMFLIQKCGIWLYKRDYNTVSDVQMRDGSQLMFCQDPVNGEMGYTFRKRVKREYSYQPKCWTKEYTPMNDSVVLPPFEKHSYPSYEDTDNKTKKRRPQNSTHRSRSPIGPPPL